MSNKSGCDFCNNKKSDYGFFIDANVFYYKWGRTRSGPEGIIIHFCPMCGKDLNAEHEREKGEQHE